MSRRHPFPMSPPRHVLKQLHRRPPVCRSIPEEYRALISLWAVRMLALSRPDPEAWLDEEGILTAAGLEYLKGRQLTGAEAVEALRQRSAELERQAGRRDGHLIQNIDRLAELVGFTPIDKEILTFLVLLHTQPNLRECAGWLGGLSPSTLSEVMAEILGLDRAAVRRALKEDGSLCASGIMRVDRAETELGDMLDLLDGLDTALLGDTIDSGPLFQAHFAPASPSSLTLDDFPHLREEASLLKSILAGAMSQGVRGVNILIYGETGAGKTEFAKTLAASLGAELLEISHENEDSDLEETHGRFRRYLLAQKMLARKSDCVILFDEVEDVFPNSVLPLFGRASNSGRYKAWTNAVLESNPRPAFWLCNEVSQIDPAFLRRFSYTLQVRTPVRSVRRRMLVTRLGDLPVSREWIDKTAANQDLTPAMIEQACTLASLTGEKEPTTLEHLMEWVLERSREVMGRKAALQLPRPGSVTRYSLKVLNPSQDLAALTESLKRRPMGRLCFYGPPGSGKTAFAHYLAEQLDKPLLKKTASDLLSCWVGGTEKHFAKMFREAKEEDAVLLLDEADSFLQDRRSALHSWEVTQVNELLVQMEAIEGLFICSTNLMDRLDQAVLRRFDLKIQFGYLKPEQAWTLWRQTLDEPERRDDDSARAVALRQRLQRLTTLTPGDFATVLRQARVLDRSYDGEQLLAALEAECRAKERGAQPVAGFHASFADCPDRRLSA